MKHGFTLLVLAASLFSSSWAQAQNVGIGTPTPTQTLDVNGSLRIRGVNGSGTRLLNTAADGTVGVSGDLPAVTVLTSPPNLGSAPVTSVQGVAVSGNYLYVSQQTTPNQIRTYDITVPTTLTAVGTPVTGGTALDLLTVAGNYIYVCDISANQIRVYTTASPGTVTTPSFVTTVATAGGGPNGAAVVGSFLYIANYTASNIERFSLANPALPVSQGTTAAGGGVAGLAALNGYLYAANYSANTLQTFSINTSTGAITSVNVQTVGSQPNAVATANGLLYLTNSGNNNLQTFSLSNPAVPASQGTVPTGGRPYGFAVKGNYAYISNTTSGTVEVRQLTLSNALGFDANGNLASIPSTALGDNLGNHTATTNLNLNGNYLVGGTLGTPGTLGVYVSPTGAVGVNTLTPISQLSNGSANTLGSDGNGGGTSSLSWAATQTGYVGQLFNGNTSATGNGLAVKINGTAAGATALDVSKGGQTVTGTSLLVVKASGNVGVGTTAPLGRLDVQGGADGGGANDPGGLAFSYRTGGYRHFIRSRHNATVNTTGNDLDFYLNSSTAAGTSTLAGTGNIQVLTLESNNSQPRVGIGTTTPAAALDVVGTSKLGTNGTAFNAIIRVTANLDPPSIPSGSAVTVTFTLANTITGATVYLSPAGDLTNGINISNARVSAAGTIAVKFSNSTPAAVDPAAMDYYVTIIQ